MKKKLFFYSFVCVIFFQSLSAQFPNPGNYNDSSSCFLNATMQSLFHIKPFRDYLARARKESFYATGSKPMLIINYIDEVAQAKNRVHPWTFRQAITKNASLRDVQEMASGQHDAPVLVRYIINILREDTQPHQELGSLLIKKLTFSKADYAASKIAENFLSYVDKNYVAYDAGLIKKVMISYLKRLYLEYLQNTFFKNRDLSSLDALIQEMQQQDPASPPVNYFLLRELIQEIGAAFFVLPDEIKTSYQALPQQKEVDKRAAIRIRLQAKSVKQPEKFMTVLYNFYPRFFGNLNTMLLNTPKNAWSELEKIIVINNWDEVIEKIKAHQKIQGLFNSIFQIDVENNDEYTCSNCSFTSSKKEEEYYSILEVALQGQTELVGCLNNHFEETFERQCPTCGTENIQTRTVKITKLPLVMIIQLKRFLYGYDVKDKINDAIAIPLSLDLKSYSILTLPKTIFTLIGLLIHGGGLDGGHYWNYSRYFKDNQWYHYDDILGSPVTLAPQAEIDGIRASGKPYLLFYELDGGELPQSVELPQSDDTESPLVPKLKELVERLKKLSDNLQNLKTNVSMLGNELKKKKAKFGF